MYIVRRGKELLLRRLYWNYSTSGSVVFSGINYFVYGDQFDASFLNDNTTGLKNPLLGVPITTPPVMVVSSGAFSGVQSGLIDYTTMSWS